jgi:C1A family cysteine protease
MSGKPQAGAYPVSPLSRRFGKVYATPEERAAKAAVYAANVAEIEAWNAGGHSFTKGVNHFADLTYDEWRAQTFRSGKRPGRSGPARAAVVPPEHEALIRAGLPASVNWTAHGAVTPVKNQGQCGSCWAFATGAWLWL